MCIVLSHCRLMMITSHTENSLDIFNFPRVVVSQVKHTSTSGKDLLLYFMTVNILIYFNIRTVCVMLVQAHTGMSLCVQVIVGLLYV